MARRHVLLFILPMLTACTSVTGSDLEIAPISIDSVDVQILESVPVQVKARVQGTIGDGCSELESVTQERTGNEITITILRRRPKDAFCTQIAKLYDETLTLGGEFPSGSYVLRVNDVEKTFQVD
jgi:hypothetical protein